MMCTTWSKSLMVLGVTTSLLNHWLILIALYPLAANILSRFLHRDLWPAKTTCAIGSYSRVNTHEQKMESTK